MKKQLLMAMFCLIYTFSSVIANETKHDVVGIGKITKIKKTNQFYFYFTDGDKTYGYPLKVSDEKILKEIKTLEKNDQAIVKGHFEFVSVDKGESIHFDSIFHAGEITIINLKSLGVEKNKLNLSSYQKLNFSLKNGRDKDPRINVPGTVTNSILMMTGLYALTEIVSSMKSNAQTNSMNSKALRNDVIFGAGAIMTGGMILDALKIKKKK